jgi:hypothetical protein
MKKALVIGFNDGNLWHEQMVRNNFMETAPIGWECNIAQCYGKSAGTITNVVVNPTTVAMAVQYAIDNNYKILISCYSSSVFYIPEWSHAKDHEIYVCVAHGSNNHVELSYPNMLRDAITVGGGNIDNERSYGKGLELFDAEANGGTAESNTVPVVAGKLAQILNINPHYNFWDVRQHLRQISSNYITKWTLHNGYGRPSNIYSGLVLDMATPLEINAYKTNDSKSVVFSWKNIVQTKYAATVIKVDKTIIYDGIGNNFNWLSTLNGSHIFRIYQRDSFGTLSMTESYATFTISDLIANPANTHSSHIELDQESIT